MDPIAILSHCLWTGLFAAGLGVMLTAPAQYLVACFFCGFVGRGVKDITHGFGVDVNWATAIAALAVVLVAAALTRRQTVSPVVLICGALPLGASVAMFHLIFALMKVSTAKETELAEASLALTANLGKVFTISLAVALGLGAGVALVKLLRRRVDEAIEV